MNRIIRMLLVISACAATQAFAGTDPESPAAATAEQSSQATSPGAQTSANAPTQTSPNAQASASAQAPAADVKKVTKVVLTDNSVSDMQLKQILSKGYHPEKRGDDVRYCRREAELGTRFEKKICRSATEILDEHTYGKELVERAQSNPGREP